jgi:hypothetical protein
MAKYKVNVPYIPDMGSIAPFIVSQSPRNSKEDEALWEINSMRDHDGLPHRKTLPRGVTFTPIA